MGKKFWANVILCLFIGGVASVVLANINTVLTPKGLFVKDIKPSAEAAELMDKVVLTQFSMGEKPGKKVKSDFVIRNMSEKDIKNVKVACEFLDGQDKYLDREQWLLSDTIPSGGMKSQPSETLRFVHTDTRKVMCQVVDFDVVDEPFFALHRVEGGHGDAPTEGHGNAAGAHH